MPGNYFSDRAEIYRPADGLISGDIPNRVRDAVRNELARLFSDFVDFKYGVVPASELFKFVVVELDLPPETLASGGFTFDRDGASAVLIDQWLHRAVWNEFLDACVAVQRFLRGNGFRRRWNFHPEAHSQFANVLNRAFRRYYSEYVMDSGGMIRVEGSTRSEAAIGEARAILSSEAFTGPDRQFQTAILALSNRPDPDYESAVTNAVNALEGVANIVLGESSLEFGRAMNRIRDEQGLHPALSESLKKIHGYGSDEAGRHGLVGKPQVDRQIAEFCVHQCASAIIFLARMSGHDQQVISGE